MGSINVYVRPSDKIMWETYAKICKATGISVAESLRDHAANEVAKWQGKDPTIVSKATLETLENDFTKTVKEIQDLINLLKKQKVSNTENAFEALGDLVFKTLHFETVTGKNAEAVLKILYTLKPKEYEPLDSTQLEISIQLFKKMKKKQDIHAAIVVARGSQGEYVANELEAKAKAEVNKESDESNESETETESSPLLFQNPTQNPS